MLANQDAPTSVADPYEIVPYESRFVAATHPDRLATMAVLYGLTPPPVERARVLEIGCADGGNLLAMAQSLPKAQFVGVDRAEKPLAEGRDAAASIGFANVDLRAMNFVDIDDGFGQFDYIICHGVYSWVSLADRAKILEICARRLTPDGIAYVSYNTFPGWHLRGMAREMMLYHTAPIADATAKVGEARGLLDFLGRVALPNDGAYAHALRAESEMLAKKRDDFVYHEHLETENHPVYFHEFVSEANHAGLRYVAPARFQIVESNLPPEVAQGLARVSTDRIRYEQYLDFALGRSFRQSLLCHVDRTSRDLPTVDAVRNLRVTASAAPESPTPDVRSESSEKFRSQYGDQLTINRPLLKAAVVCLYERWPRSAGFEEIWKDCLIRLDRPGTAGPGEDRDSFTRVLMEAHFANLIDFHTYDPPLTLEPGDKPVGAPLARRLAATSPNVISLRNSTAALHDLDRALLQHLDGTRDRAALVDLMEGWVAGGHLAINRHEPPGTPPIDARAILAASLDESLKRLAADALLMAT